jgi:hypothetical protein
MDRIIYKALCSYYNALEKTGYQSFKQTEKLLVLCFLRDFVYNDYRGLISKDDYLMIERALDCLYGSTCLIPYPDYLKMGKLHIGEMTEMAQRVKTLEETEVLKAFDGDDENSDIMILSEDDDS